MPICTASIVLVIGLSVKKMPGDILTIQTETVPRRRGRPAKTDRSSQETREALIRSGLELLTKTGFLSTGIDAIVKNVQVPKGSFYYYFENKEVYGHEVLDAYDHFFEYKLNKYLSDSAFSPMTRLHHFVQSGARGMKKHDFSCGCMVGNMMQESAGLPESFCQHLKRILENWQNHISACLAKAMESGEISSSLTPEKLAVVFLSSWEGAVMRARLFRSEEPLEEFWAYFSGSVCSKAL